LGVDCLHQGRAGTNDEQGPRVWLALGLALVALAGCGGDSENGPSDDQDSQPARLGCGEYCQQAGGYGGGSAGGPMVSIDTGRRVEALPDGSVPITMTCLFPATCEGAVLATSHGSSISVEGGRSDLLVEAGSSRTIAVPLTQPDRQVLEQAGEVKVVVTADIFPTLETLPEAERSEWNAVVPKVIVVTEPAS
jgi:hypothetical protein